MRHGLPPRQLSAGKEVGGETGAEDPVVRGSAAPPTQILCQLRRFDLTSIRAIRRLDGVDDVAHELWERFNRSDIAPTPRGLAFGITPGADRFRVRRQVPRIEQRVPEGLGG